MSLERKQRIPKHSHEDDNSGGRIAAGDAVTGLPTGGTITSAGGASVLDDLGDVDLVTTPPADNDALTYDSATGQWVPEAVSSSSNDTSLVTVAATGSTETVDVSVARTYDLTLTADCTLTLTGATTAEAWFLTLLLRQDGTGGWDVTWPGSVVWPDGVTPTLDATAASVNTFTLLTLDGGTTWYGFPTGGGGGSALTVKDEGSTLTTAASSLDFVGAGVTATGTGVDKTITIPGVTSADIVAMGFVGPLVISDSPSTPLVFADLVQNEDQDDLVYADIP